MKPYYQDEYVTLYHGDCREVLLSLPAESVQCCVTSPPYFGLRDYGHAAQIGLEQTPDAYVAELVAVFREVRRVLRDDGTLWLNLGDSYAGGGRGGNPLESPYRLQASNSGSLTPPSPIPAGLKAKDMIGIPWRVAFALQADGWYLRQDIIWHKPNPMPESVRDRCTKAHEYLFLLSKSARYYYDAGAIAEEAVTDPAQPSVRRGGFNGKSNALVGREAFRAVTDTRNARSVWPIATQPYKGAHFATMPPKLVERCILAGAPAGGAVLDPFGGAGTTGAVAKSHNRRAILAELNDTYCALAVERWRQHVLDLGA